MRQHYLFFCNSFDRFRLREQIDLSISETILVLEESFGPSVNEVISDNLRDKLVHQTARLSFLCTSKREVESLLPA